MLNRMLKDLDNYREKDKSILLEKYVNDRLSKSLQVYYDSLIKSLNSLTNKDAYKVLKSISKLDWVGEQMQKTNLIDDMSSILSMQKVPFYKLIDLANKCIGYDLHEARLLNEDTFSVEAEAVTVCFFWEP